MVKGLNVEIWVSVDRLVSRTEEEEGPLSVKYLVTRDNKAGGGPENVGDEGRRGEGDGTESGGKVTEHRLEILSGGGYVTTFTRSRRTRLWDR